MRKNTLRNIAFMAAGMALFFNLSLAGAAIITYAPFDPVYTLGQDPVIIKIVGQDFVAGVPGIDALNQPATTESGSMGGGLSVSWDASVLKLVEVTRTFSGDLGMSTAPAPDGRGVIDNDAGTLAGFSVSSFLTGTSQAEFDIAELRFTFVGPGISNLSLNISELDVWTDGAGRIDVKPNGVGGTITVSGVPLPPALLLFGSSLLGMVSFNRRRSVAA